MKYKCTRCGEEFDDNSVRPYTFCPKCSSMYIKTEGGTLDYSGGSWGDRGFEKKEEKKE